MREVAAGLCNLGYIPELLLSSPLIRAGQTADILLRAFGKKVELRSVQCLAPSGRRGDLYREIAGYSRDRDSLMLVGHQPSLGEIAGEIAWGSPDHWIDLKKGGVCAIEVDSVQGVPKGRLISLLPPSILRAIANRKSQIP
jgi:phosphohistidine phosphatase